MFKEVLNHANLTIFAELGLVIFVLVFAGTTVWAFTRSRRQIQAWSEIPLSDVPATDQPEARS